MSELRRRVALKSFAAADSAAAAAAAAGGTHAKVPSTELDIGATPPGSAQNSATNSPITSPITSPALTSRNLRSKAVPEGLEIGPTPPGSGFTSPITSPGLAPRSIKGHLAAVPAVSLDAVDSKPKSSLFGLPSFTLLALLVLLPLRVWSACTMPILDCDETFNYWEPLHYLMFGRGLQTWEYAPSYGLRSYFYLLIASPAAWLLKSLQEFSTPDVRVDKIVLFYAVRVSFALGSVWAETGLVSSLARRSGCEGIAKWTLLFLSFVPGTLHASQSFLPQSWTSIIVTLAFASWVRGGYKAAIFWTGISALIGWPFSIILAIPLAIEVVWVYRRRLYVPIIVGLLTTILCVVPSVAVDFVFYRKPLLAVLNIARYNSDHTSSSTSSAAGAKGANLYGVEPASFYFKNLAVNFNVAFALALSAPVLVLISYLWRRSRKGACGTPCEALSRFTAPFLIWFAVFLSMPHKEERFLFVMYPYVAFSAALGMHVLTNWVSGRFSAFGKVDENKPRRTFLAGVLSTFVVLSFLALSASRVGSLVVNYRAPLATWTALSLRISEIERIGEIPLAMRDVVPGTLDRPKVLSVCVGKEWHRFPTAFFTPTIRVGGKQVEAKLRFLRSGFGGLLPKDFLEASNYTPSKEDHAFPLAHLPHISSRPGTFVAPTGMNDLNRSEDDGRFVEPETCDFIVDLALPHQVEQEFDKLEIVLQKQLRMYGRCVRGWRWKVIHSTPFLSVDESHNALARAFFLPGYSEQHNQFRPYQLLERVPLPCTP